MNAKKVVDTKLVEFGNGIQNIADVNDLQKVEGLVTIKAFYADYPSISNNTERSARCIISDAAEEVQAKFSKDKEFANYIVTGVKAEDLIKFFNVIEEGFNEPGYNEPGEDWSWNFDCFTETE